MAQEEGCGLNGPVAGLSQALAARLSGLEGDLEGCLAQASAAIDSFLAAGGGGSYPAAADAAVAYAYLLQGKALFGLGRLAEAKQAFASSLSCAPSSSFSGVDSYASSLTPLRLLMIKISALFDLKAARKGASACSKMCSLQQQEQQQRAPVDSCSPSADIPTTPTLDSEGGESQEDTLPFGPQGGPLDPRSRYTVPGVTVDGSAGGNPALPVDVTLPRNTSWVVRGRLMGASTPKNR